VFSKTSGAGLDALRDGLFNQFSAGIPDEFDTACVVITANKDSGPEICFDRQYCDQRCSRVVIDGAGAVGVIGFTPLGRRQRAK